MYLFEVIPLVLLYPQCGAVRSKLNRIILPGEELKALDPLRLQYS